MQKYAKSSGLECNSPRGCLKTAFQLKLIGYQPQWLEMLADRNAGVHVYDEKFADHLYQMYQRLPKYLKLLEKLAKKLGEELGEGEEL